MINSNIIKYSLLILLILSLCLILYKQYKDTFMNEKNTNFENDGNMTFEYLSNNNYKNEVLNKYYLDDDIKKSGKRINIHPYQRPYKTKLLNIIVNGKPKNYSINSYGSNPYNHVEDKKKYGEFKTFAEYIYRLYGVRR